jgi:hypothetical protein
MTGSARPLVSVLVVVSERPVDLASLYQAYSTALRNAGWTFEFIFIVTRHCASRTESLRPLRDAGEPVRVVEVAHNVGDATLLRLAAARAEGQVLLSTPAYWRVVPDSVPELLRGVEAGADMVVARRWPRADSWVNRVQNRVFHRLLRWLSGSRLNDLACGVRAFTAEVIDEVPLYGDFDRFFPVLAHHTGFRVQEVACPQHPDDVSPRVYSPGVYLRRLLDLFGMFFLLRFTNKPLRFFGMVGSTFSILGAVILLVVTVQRFEGQGLANRPILLLGVLLLALGVQAIALGLIGEIVVFLSAPERPSYRLARETEHDTGHPASESPDRGGAPASAPGPRSAHGSSKLLS